ncbi:MAG: HlyD family efflux transporter periplasmic adaptor subunit [Boseongicola sp.]
MSLQMPHPELSGTRRSHLMIWLISATFVVLGIWSYHAVLDEVVRGPGKVVPSSRTQVIQSLEGGILSEVLVTEGQIVPAGEVLARLDDTKFQGSFREVEGQVTALEAKLHRLEQELAFSEQLELPALIRDSDPSVLRSEEQLFRARRTEYESTTTAFASTVALQRQEVDMLKVMSDQNLVPRLDLVTAQKKLSQVKADQSAYAADYVLTRSEEYSAALTELKQLQATLEVRKDQLVRTSLNAPVRGIVNKVLITTIGGVVSPGDAILELTPLDDVLRVEARISPKDIAFVSPKMRATVKLTAYDYTIFGSFPGEVVHISADTFEDESARDRNPYYRGLIGVEASALEKNGEIIEIRPGMLAEAELNVGDKTVFQYLLKPLFKTREAFREP